MTDAPKPRVVRRVVTGHEHNNVAKVILDGPASNVKRPAPTFGSIAIWASDTMPVQIPAGQADEIEDCGQRILPTQPPPNGTRFIVMEFDPGAESAMHRTETIDYIACLEGEIDMDMDDFKGHVARRRRDGAARDQSCLDEPFEGTRTPGHRADRRGTAWDRQPEAARLKSKARVAERVGGPHADSGCHDLTCRNSVSRLLG